MEPFKKELSYAWFKLNFPLRTEEKQIIYIEDKYNPRINQYIERHYEEIEKLFVDRGYNFVYIPVKLKNIQNENPNIIQYYRPSGSDDFKTKKDPVPQDIYDSLFSFLKYKRESLKPGFICYQATIRDRLVFSYFKLRFVSEDDFREQIEWYIQNIKPWVPVVAEHSDVNIPYSHKSVWTIEEEPEEEYRKGPPSICFSAYIDLSLMPRSITVSTAAGIYAESPKEADKVIAEIKDKIDDTLKQYGIGIDEWILQIISKPQKLSKLRVTEDYRILLTDYDNLEVHLTPLQKALYLFFLNHPEGIFFKDLSDYKEELKNIYKKLSYRDTIEKSINFIIDSTRYNTVNENCSRIREAFINKLGGRLAENYCITGGRLTLKRIPLDRKLVRIEANI